MKFGFYYEINFRFSNSFKQSSVYLHNSFVDHSVPSIMDLRTMPFLWKKNPELTGFKVNSSTRRKRGCSVKLKVITFIIEAFLLQLFFKMQID